MTLGKDTPVQSNVLLWHAFSPSSSGRSVTELHRNNTKNRMYRGAGRHLPATASPKPSMIPTSGNFSKSKSFQSGKCIFINKPL